MEYAPCHGLEDVPAPTGYWRKATDYMIQRIQDKTRAIFMPIVGIAGASRKYLRKDGKEGFHYFMHCKDEDDIIVFRNLHTKVIKFVVDRVEGEEVFLNVENAFTGHVDDNIVVMKDKTLKFALGLARDKLHARGVISEPTGVKHACLSKPNTTIKTMLKTKRLQ
jgi:hypothetical protein